MEKTRRKPTSRSSRLTHSRRGSQVNSSVVVNTAEARREIVNALHLHRSSTTPPQPQTGTPQLPPSCFGTKWAFPFGGATSTTHEQQQQQQGCLYSLPLPQPTWSTTSPSIFPTSTSTSSGSSSSSSSSGIVPMEMMMMMNEFEWADELASSYTWWFGFLKTLDNGKEVLMQQQRQQQQQQVEYSSFAGSNVATTNDSNGEECEWLIMSDHDQLELDDV